MPLQITIRREAIIRGLIAVFGLALAFAAAVLSSAARETGNLLATAILASSALLLAAVVAIATVPYLARRVIASRLRDTLQFRLTKEGIIYLGFVLVVAISALNTGNNLLFLIVSVLLAALAVGSAASAAELRVLELNVSLPEQAFAGRDCPAQINVRNRSRWIPAFSIAVGSSVEKQSGKNWSWERTVFEFPRRTAGREPWLRLRDLRLQRVEPPPPLPPILRNPVYFPYIHPNSSTGAELLLCFERRGLYSQDAFAVSTRFPFSFLVQTRRVPLNRDLIVYPKLEQSEQFYEVLPMVTGDFERHQRGRGQDLYLIRDYQPNDSVRHVDWKASAKAGTLKIREFAREDERRLRLVFDNAGPGEVSTESYEKGVSLAASLAWHLEQESASVTFAATGLPENNLGSFMRHLALVEPSADPCVLDSLPLGMDFNLVLTWKPRGTIVSSIWQSSYVVFLNP